MFSCEYCEILQSSFFFRTPLSASVDSFSTIGQFSNNMKYVGREGASPLPLLENRTKALTLEKRPHCVHLWVELFIRNVVFNLSRKKKSKISPCRPFFVILTKCLSKCLSSMKPSLPLKFSVCTPDILVQSQCIVYSLHFY